MAIQNQDHIKQIKNPEIEEILNLLVKKINPEKIILFGSYAKGNYSAESDIDLLIVNKTKLSKPKRIFKIRKLLSKFSTPKDIVYKTPDEFGKFAGVVNTLDHEIASHGIILYER